MCLLYLELLKFMLPRQYTGYVEEISVQLKEHECFIGCAKELILSGKKISELCKHNASVCRKYGKHNATTLWNFVEIAYGYNELNKQKYEHRNSFSNQKNSQTSRRPTQVVSTDLLKWDHNENNNANGPDADTELKSQDDDTLLDSNGAPGKQSYPPHGSVILSESQILTEITFDNFDALRNGFIYVGGPPDFAKALSPDFAKETALHCDVQAARPQLDIKAEDRDKSPVREFLYSINMDDLNIYFFLSFSASQSTGSFENYFCSTCAFMGTSPVYS